MMADKVCIGCEAPQGEPHETWCPVVTGTLSSLRERPGKSADRHDKRIPENPAI
jgi:hypothetical protein